MDPLVAHEANDERDKRNDDDADGVRDLLIGDDTERLGASDRVDRRPADTGNAVEKRDNLEADRTTGVSRRAYLESRSSRCAP
jgi:hypothetical protein